MLGLRSSTKYRKRGREVVTTYGGKVVPELRFFVECNKDGGGKEEVTDRLPLVDGEEPE